MNYPNFELIDTKEAMRLLGYKDRSSFTRASIQMDCQVASNVYQQKTTLLGTRPAESFKSLIVFSFNSPPRAKAS